jgi:hypothetical protein
VTMAESPLPTLPGTFPNSWAWRNRSPGQLASASQGTSVLIAKWDTAGRLVDLSDQELLSGVLTLQT